MTTTALATTARGLARLHEATSTCPALGRLTERAEEFDRLLGSEYDPAAVESPPSRAWLSAAAAAARLAAPGEVVDTLVRLGEDLPADDRRSLTAATTRGLSPHGAMATVPRERLFTIDEWHEVASLPLSRTPASRVDLRQPVGRPMDYQGYLCVILKITRACNLRCTYCTDWRAGAGATMSLAMQARAVQQTMSTGARAIDVVLHGGEPLLLGARGLTRLLALQEHFAPPGVIVRTQVQTNGTVLRPEVRRLLRLFGIRVSVSLDGTQRLHDAARRSKTGGATWARVLHGITDLRHDATLSGVLVVVTPAMLAEDPARLWEDLVRTTTPSVCFLAERPAPGDPPRVSRRDFVDFLVRMERVRAARGDRVAIREVDSVRRTLQRQQSGFCELAGNCVGHFIAIDPDGSVSHCDKYLGDPAYTLGNLSRTGLRDILAAPPVVRIRRQAQAPLDEVSACRWYELCQGWCPHERYVDSTWGSDGCCGLGPLYDHLAGHDVG